jgi:CHRD domain
MKTTLKFVVVTVAALLLTAASASAQVIKMAAVLSPGEETPALLSGAVGTAEVGVDVTNREISVTLRVFNLPTASTAGHIHVGPRGVAGPVVLDFPNIPGRTGDFTLTFRLSQTALRPSAANGINTMEDIVQSIIGGNAYVNIHSTTNPAGEIRGQLAIVP